MKDIDLFTDAELAELRGVINAELYKRNKVRLAGTVLAALKYIDFEQDTPIAVVFEASEYDDGYYLSPNRITVFFEDGTNDGGYKLNPSFDIETHLTDTFGMVGPNSAAGVDLRTEEVTFADTAKQVYSALGVTA